MIWHRAIFKGWYQLLYLHTTISTQYCCCNLFVTASVCWCRNCVSITVTAFVCDIILRVLSLCLTVNISSSWHPTFKVLFLCKSADIKRYRNVVSKLVAANIPVIFVYVHIHQINLWTQSMPIYSHFCCVLDNQVITRGVNPGTWQRLHWCDTCNITMKFSNFFCC